MASGTSHQETADHSRSARFMPATYARPARRLPRKRSAARPTSAPRRSRAPPAPPAGGTRNRLQAEAAGSPIRSVLVRPHGRPRPRGTSTRRREMTTIRLRTAAAALAVAAIGATIAATSAHAAPHPPERRSPSPHTTSATGRSTSDHGQGFAVGYVELVANKLMHGGKQIGHDGESYTVTRLGAGSATSCSRLSRSSPTARSTSLDWSPRPIGTWHLPARGHRRHRQLPARPGLRHGGAS